MGTQLRAQALSMLLALGGGAGLGLLYDLLRALRRQEGRDGFWDFLFCLSAAALAFLFAMRAENGALGTGVLLSALLGLLFYFDLLSRLLLPVFSIFFRKIRVLRINTQNSAKKVPRIAKKLFQIFYC